MHPIFLIAVLCNPQEILSPLGSSRNPFTQAYSIFAEKKTQKYERVNYFSFY
jgi:hypothetical protein